VSKAVSAPCFATKQSDAVLNGRFKGGWTTRHYGQPGSGVHAIQMELAQRAYLAAEAAPWTYAPQIAAPLRAVLGQILQSLDSLARSGALNL
jgi:formiminoglutamase